MATVLKEFKPHESPTADMPRGLTIAPTMATVIVDGVAVVNPELASIIRNNTVAVMSRLEDSHSTCPACCKVVIASKAIPSAASVPVVDLLSPASHLRPTAIQVLTMTALAKVESVLSEVAMAINCSMASHTTCSYYLPSVS
jgi:hypothetical protein